MTSKIKRNKYEESEAYQNEIAAQYKERVEKFSVEEVSHVLSLLGFKKVDPATIKPAIVGNVNATYLTPKFVIKMNRKRGEADYIANKIISDCIAATHPVVRVLSYDTFKKTPFEVLVMKRSVGSLLLKDIFKLNKKQQAVVFRQILKTVKAMFSIRFNDFGLLSTRDHFKSYAEYLTKRFKSNVKEIKKLKLCGQNDLAKIERYFIKNVKVFGKGTESVFVHTDLHPGNMLHKGNKLTAILDFDYSLKAPKMRVLLSLLGFIDKPSQFVEGTKDFKMYKGKNFYHLLPILRDELSELFADPLLLEKLNLHFISEGLRWVAANWSADWNKQMIKMIVENELPDNKKDLVKSYYGKVLAHK